MEVDFSVIIPVFNSEKTIMKCMESLQQQTVASFEILIIDDGSSDKSGMLCDKIAETDHRFKVIHQKNAGVSSARNTALSMAKGHFVTFVYSDDTVEYNYLECLKKEFKASGADAVFMGYKTYSSTGEKLEENIPRIYSNIFEIQISKLSEKHQFGYTWVKAFRRCAIGDQRFRENISLFEDEIFTCEVLAKCRGISVVGFPIYHYTYGSKGTLMGEVHQDYCELQDQVYLAWKGLLSNSEYSSEILEKKANELADTCQYYLYEKNINVDLFLEAASKCTFIAECTLDTSFFKALKKGKWGAVKYMRYLYLAKIKVAELLHR